MSLFNKLLMGLLVVLLSGCASYQMRKKCEATNWFEYGKQFALSGKRLDADVFTKQCREVEAKIDHAGLDRGFKSGMEAYCKESYASHIGLEGENYNYSFCDNNQVPKLKSAFEKGREKLCGSGGYEFGAKGKKYTGQCLDRGEPKFMGEYKRGRNKYLKNEIQLAESKKVELDSQIAGQRARIRQLQTQLALTPPVYTYVSESTYDPVQKKHVLTQKRVLDQVVESERNSISSEISSANYKIQSYEKEMAELDTNIAEFKRELVLLD